jgi:hypothetical protein
MAGEQQQSRQPQREDERQTRQDSGGIESFEVDDQRWETDASREQPGLGERIARGEVPPPAHESVEWAYPEREAGTDQSEAGQGAGTPDQERHDEQEQRREPPGQRGESSPPPQTLGNPGTTGDELDTLGPQPI